MVRHQTKIAIAVEAELPVWQKLNVVAFLASGVAARHPEIIDEPYEDACGTRYLALFGLPVLCFSATPEQLSKGRLRAKQRGLSVGLYTRQMFETGNDIDNRAVVRAVGPAELDLVGLAVHGERKEVDKALKGLRLHP